MNRKYLSRKWMLSVGVQLAATVALFGGLLEGSHYATISSANIAAYSFANAAAFFGRHDRPVEK